jgi:hypothetical protein
MEKLVDGGEQVYAATDQLLQAGRIAVGEAVEEE